MRAELSKAQARLMMVLEMGDRLEANPDARPPHESEVENGKVHHQTCTRKYHRSCAFLCLGHRELE